MNQQNSAGKSDYRISRKTKVFTSIHMTNCKTPYVQPKTKNNKYVTVEIPKAIRVGSPSYYKLMDKQKNLSGSNVLPRKSYEVETYSQRHMINMAAKGKLLIKEKVEKEEENLVKFDFQIKDDDNEGRIEEDELLYDNLNIDTSILHDKRKNSEFSRNFPNSTLTTTPLHREKSDKRQSHPINPFIRVSDEDEVHKDKEEKIVNERVADEIAFKSDSVSPERDSVFRNELTKKSNDPRSRSVIEYSPSKFQSASTECRNRSRSVMDLGQESSPERDKGNSCTIKSKGQVIKNEDKTDSVSKVAVAKSSDRDYSTKSPQRSKSLAFESSNRNKNTEKLEQKSNRLSVQEKPHAELEEFFKKNLKDNQSPELESPMLKPSLRKINSIVNPEDVQKSYRKSFNSPKSNLRLSIASKSNRSMSICDGASPGRSSIKQSVTRSPSKSLYRSVNNCSIDESDLKINDSSLINFKQARTERSIQKQSYRKDGKSLGNLNKTFLLNRKSSAEKMYTYELKHKDDIKALLNKKTLQPSPNITSNILYAKSNFKRIDLKREQMDCANRKKMNKKYSVEHITSKLGIGFL